MKIMKTARFDRLGILLLLLGTVPAFAVQEKHGGPERQQEERPAEKQEPRRQSQQERPQQHQEQARPQQRQEAARAQQARPQQHQEPARAEQARPGQPQARGHQPEPQRAGARQARLQDHRAGNFQSEHRDWQQRGGYHGYRIPESRFRGHFGEDHRFRMSSYPMRMYGGHPRFQYGGVWLSVLDPWPEFWGPNWYADDDMYIGFSGGGYYLYNRSYPGSQIALSVSL
jgi:hypothetical protein